MTEKIAFEVRPKKGKKLQKVFFFKAFFDHLVPSGVKKFVPHEIWEQNKLFRQKISILPRKMTENLAVKVDVKNPDREVGVVHLIYFVSLVR